MKWQDSSHGEAWRNESDTPAEQEAKNRFLKRNGKIAQLVRALGSYPGGPRFDPESCYFFSSEQSNEQSERQKINRRVVGGNFLWLRLMQGLFYKFWVLLFFRNNFVTWLDFLLKVLYNKFDNYYHF